MLLNQRGQSPFQHHRSWAYGPIQAGVKYQQKGQVTISAPLPGIRPQLYLVQQLDPAQLHNLSMPMMLLLALLVIALISFFLASMQVRRIRRLHHAAQIIAAGDLSARVNLPGGDESVRWRRIST